MVRVRVRDSVRVRVRVVIRVRLRFIPSIQLREGRKEMFYLTTHSTHFIYGYMASDIW